MFEIEQDTLFGEYYSTKNKTDDKNSKDTVKVKQLLAYKPTFYLNDLNNTIDFFKTMKEKYDNATGPIVVVVREFCVLDKDVVDAHIPNEFSTVIEENCVACDRIPVKRSRKHHSDTLRP